MTTWALVVNSYVNDIIVADQDYITDVIEPQGYTCVNIDGYDVNIGYGYDGYNFLIPVDILLYGPNTSVSSYDQVELSVMLNPPGLDGYVDILDENNTILETIRSTDGIKYNVGTLSPGSYKYKARYNGETTHTTKISNTLDHISSKKMAALELIGSNSSNVNDTITFKVYCSVNIIEDTISLKHNADVITTATLSSGYAEFTVTGLAAGSYDLVAVFDGNNMAYQMTSNTLQHTVS